MTTVYRPMKPVKVPLEALFHYAATPLIATPKIDGIRCMLINGVATSASGKPLPNRYIQAILAKYPELNNFDGELIVPGATFQQTTSVVMSEYHISDFIWLLFDCFGTPYTYEERTVVVKRKADLLPMYCVSLETAHIANEADAVNYLNRCLTAGHEGAVFRHPYSLYKHGRSTLRERGMMAVKPFVDAEAIVIGFEQLYANHNEPTLDAFGLTKRGSSSQGQVPMETLGALKVQTMGSLPVTFSIGTGFTAAERSAIWHNQPLYIGKMLTYKYLPHGTKDAPRHPVFVRWRDPIDVT